MIFGTLSFDLKDAIDIILVALLLFYIYRLMRASSSSNIFTGVLVFIIVWIFVSQFLKMRLLGSIFDRLINVGALALIVLFQEEIRQFFSSIGTQRASLFIRWLRRHGKNESLYHEDVMALVRACISMGKQKVGALIVLERYQNLFNLSKSGEQIDAKISQRLIENIFFKNSPLHDGAMIISKVRIHAAGCLLPVSHDADIPKSLGLRHRAALEQYDIRKTFGTRHRAALGVSQKYDCLAIVVSEETGGVSVALEGQLYLQLTSEELEKHIMHAFSIPPEKKEKEAAATEQPNSETSVRHTE